MPERYELIRHIANGGMASVWCAEDRVLGRRVAIKLLAERFAYDQTAVRRFKREARTAARLSGHPNVVTIYDVGETTTPDPDAPARAFIVMEFLAGGTVADALRCDAVTQTEAIWWLHEVASALDYAHARGVLHRDIKPANVLLDGNRSVHVADFGIAQLATEDTLTADGELLGTAAYLAPERAMGRPATDASDRYSLAVMAFELLVGERPFTDQRFAVQARQHVDAPPPSASERNPRLPEALDAVLARGMAKRPEDRFPTAHALAEAVESALAEPDTSATTATAVLAAARGATASRGANAARRVTPAPVGGARSARPRPRPRRPGPEPPPSTAPASLTPRSQARDRGRGAGGSGCRGRAGSRRDAQLLAECRRLDRARPANCQARRAETRRAAEGQAQAPGDPAHADSGQRHAGGGHHDAADRRHARGAGTRADGCRQVHIGDPGAAQGGHHRITRKPDLRLRAVRFGTVAAAIGRPARGGADPLQAPADPQPDRRGPTGAAARAAGPRPAGPAAGRRGPGRSGRARTGGARAGPGSGSGHGHDGQNASGDLATNQD